MITLHLDTRPDWRGGQNQVLLTLRGLRARGYHAELMALHDGPLERRALAEGFRVHSISRQFVRIGAARQLRSLLKQKRFDIVHAHDPHGLTAAWLAGAHRSTALVVQRRIALPLSPSRVGLARYRAARRILAVSRFVAESVVASGIDPERVEVNYEGVELPLVTTPEARIQARKRWGVAADERLMGCVGYLLPEKAQDVLIRALPTVRKRFLGCRLLLAGDGPRRPALEKLACELGVAQAVIFGGFIEAIESVYRALDLFLFPSLAEPLGTSLLAAMSYGLPAVGVASGGVLEVIDHERNGLLAARPHAGDFAAAIVLLLGDLQRAAALGAAARATIAKKFTADRMVEGTVEKYDKILAESP